MIEKDQGITPKDDFDFNNNNENFDNNEELNNSLENLLKNKNRDIEKDKDKKIDFQKKTTKDLSYYFNYSPGSSTGGSITLRVNVTVSSPEL